MLEKPNIQDEQIVDCLREQYGLAITEVEFLPLGADANATVYRVTGEDGTPYFLKLRSGAFDEMAVALPRFLYDQGVRQIIAPMPTTAGRLWGSLDKFTMILYPFIDGKNGWQVALTPSQWIEFGAAFRQIHALVPPPALASQLQHETYSPKWCEMVRDFQARAERETFVDPISVGLAALLNDNRAVIDDIVARAERFGQMLKHNAALGYVICHTDIHRGNLLITPNEFYIVDWDAPLLAPKERDLMFVGAGIGKIETLEQQALFFQGYGQVEIDPVALAYYRYERIVEDFAAYCEEILLSDRGDTDRAEGLRRVSSQFLPDAVIDVAYRTDRTGDHP